MFRVILVELNATLKVTQGVFQQLTSMARLVKMLLRFSKKSHEKTKFSSYLELLSRSYRFFEGFTVLLSLVGKFVSDIGSNRYGLQY